MIEILKKWEDFRAMAYTDELLIGAGAVLLLYSFLRIVKTSATTLFWIFLSCVGAGGIFQGLDKNPFVAAAAKQTPMANYIGDGKELSKIPADVLGVLCRKMEETELLQLE